MKNRVRETRESLGMSQTFLAHKANLSRGFVSNVERGTQVPSVYVSNVLAEVLGTTSEHLFPAKNVIHNVQSNTDKEAIE